MSSPHRWRRGGAAIVVASAIAACGGGVSGSAGTSSAAGGQRTPSSSSVAKGRAGPAWATDVCSIVDQATMERILDTKISGAASPPTQKRLCEYKGTVAQGAGPVTVTSIHYYNDRSEWDIRLGNLGVNPKDKLAGLGADAFKSSDGIWVLLSDGRMFIADVAYGVRDESAKELTLTKEILARA